jgi:DNA invertase Pin-like site-specific DNA recombinase
MTQTTQTNGRARYTAPTLPRVAALYARVSSKKQGEDGKASLPTQLDAMRTWAAEHGYATTDEHTYVEMHSGEELYERPVLTRLREDAKQRRPFAVVLCYSVERLARQSAYVQILLDELERLGMFLQFATEELEDTALGRAIMNMRAYAGEVESERRKDRFRRAILARVASGKPVVGQRASYGYAWADIRNAAGKLLREREIERPDTAAVVRRIWQMVDDGHTQNRIATTLTREGVLVPSGKPGVSWDPTTIHYILHNPKYWGEPEALKKRSVPVDKAVRHLYRRRFRDVPTPPSERVKLPTSVAPPLITKELAERVHARLRQNKELAPRNNHAPDATLCRGLAVCAICGTRMSVINHSVHLAGAQFRCNIGTRIATQRAKCPAGSNTIMAAKLDEAVVEEMIRLFETPGQLAAELAAARAQASDKRAEADEPASELTHKIADAERRLANLRRQAELVDAPDQQEALAARMTLLARDRDVWTRELEGKATQTARLRAKEDAILDFQQHVTVEHGSMQDWADNLMRQFLLILDARVEVWPLRAVTEGRAKDRGVLCLDLPLSGPRRLALTRLLHAEHVVAGVSLATNADDNGVDCTDISFARSTIYT